MEKLTQEIKLLITENSHLADCAWSILNDHFIDPETGESLSTKDIIKTVQKLLLDIRVNTDKYLNKKE